MRAMPPLPRLAGCLVTALVLCASLERAGGVPAALCRGPAIVSGGVCVCTGGACLGPHCSTGTSSATGQQVHGYRLGCHTCKCLPPPPRPRIPPSATTAAAGRTERVMFLTVATHREPFIELLEQSVRNLGRILHIAGHGQEFRGYGWKLKAALAEVEAHQDEFDLVVFSDSFDSYVLGSEAELVRKFRRFGHPMVVSGEVNCWPQPELAVYMPPLQGKGRYRFPNSGGYMAEVGYLIHLLRDVILMRFKSDCVDDQGELIKALALNQSAFIVDSEAAIFQTLFGWAADDLDTVGPRVANRETGTQPSVIHANGWDKEPLLKLLRRTGHIQETEAAALNNKKRELEKQAVLQKRESDVNGRCKDVNPNPSLHPDWNIVRAYGLLAQQSAMKALLRQRGTPWHDAEVMLFEIQEYRSFCPELLRPPAPVSSASRLAEHGFKVFVYPSTNTSWAAASPVYKALLFTLRYSPYFTNQPEQATVLVPALDVSCFCESCLPATGGTAMDVESKRITEELRRLAHWDGGHRHIVFEYSDGHCSPYELGHAAVAKTGLSQLHKRQGLDVSLPLFSMVEFSRQQRRLPAPDRPFLLTFKGTRSPRSDVVRKFLGELDNGGDIVMLVACRWMVEGPSGAYDKDCEPQEARFHAHTFRQLAANSTFSMIVEGFGYHSFRLNEVLGAGSIPVIAIDHYALPFDDFLDWANFSVRVPEYRLLEVPAMLRQMPASRVAAMQRRAVFVYEAFLASQQLQIHTTMELMRINALAPEAAEQQRAKLLAEGLPYRGLLDKWHLQTRPEVLRDSIECNTPEARRKGFFA